jgi:hypothetical protein
MAATYEPISTNTLATATPSVTFSAITGAYTDLVLVVNGGCASNTAVALQFNGDTATNYSSTILDGAGSVVTPARYSATANMRFGYNATWSGGLTDSAIFHITNYSNTTTYKSVLNRVNSFSQGAIDGCVGLWRSTAAVTSITVLNTNAVNYSIGTTFTLYGIKAA